MTQAIVGWRRRAAAAALAVLVAAPPSFAARPEAWDIEQAADFLDGDLDGLSVDSHGRVRLSPAPKLVDTLASPYVWTVTRGRSGEIYAGTGNEGKVFRYSRGQASLVFDAPELEIHALACGDDGTLYIGTSPEGKVYALAPDGAVKDFFDPQERYIWALALDERGDLLVATGDPGRLHRVHKDGTSEILLEGSETHVGALAVDGRRIYAGSSPSGLVYRIEGSKTFVLHDTPYREIKALATAPDGTVYVAAVGGHGGEEPPPASTPPPIPRPSEPTPAGRARTVETPRLDQTKGALLKLPATGEADLLWSSTDEMPLALRWESAGVLVATGDRGRLYRVAEDRTWTMLAALPAVQITAMVRAEDGSLLAATSNPGTLHAIGPGPGRTGSFTSRVRDTGTVSGWGRLRWRAETPGSTGLRLETRSGNTATPDKTWSEWRRCARDGEPIASEPARFLQIRAVLEGQDGATPVLSSVRATYLQRNVRPQVTSVTVHPPGAVFQKPLALDGSVQILGLDPPSIGDGRRDEQDAAATWPAALDGRPLYQKGVQTFSWKADDPNGDPLVYDLEYRSFQSDVFRPLRRDLADTVFAWDSSTVPNGRYVLRVTARDTPGNPDALALSASLDSRPFEVDNTPPAVTIVRAPDGRLRMTARDDDSPIRRAEYSVDGSAWRQVDPLDGISDSRNEEYELRPRYTGPGPHVVVVRATDQLGNTSTALLDVD